MESVDKTEASPLNERLETLGCDAEQMETDPTFTPTEYVPFFPLSYHWNDQRSLMDFGVLVKIWYLKGFL